jgi:tetratricopeptide (TPR) repeat protein
MSQKQMSQQTASQGLPADHPPLAGGQNAPDPQAMRAEVAGQLEKARNEPNNFEAQIKAAQLYYQIQRYDQAIEFLLKANTLKPTDYQTVVALAVTNLDAEHYDTAEKWYRAAMKMKSDDVMVLAGLADTTLKKGDAKAAEDAIAKLEKADPNAEDLPNFRTRLAGLKSK